MHLTDLGSLPANTGELEALASWIEANLRWLLPALVAAAWAYAKFVVEKSVLPPAEFDIELRDIDVEEDELIIEILANLRNRGSSALVVQNLWIDVLYLRKGDPVELSRNPSEEKNQNLCGRVNFRRKLRARLNKKALAAARQEALRVWKESNKDKSVEPRGIPVVPHKTFVSSGVMQRYSYVSALPADTSVVLVHAAFYYEPGGSPVQREVWRILRDLGLVSHTLQHVREPHTCERVFKLAGAGDKGDSEPRSGG